MHFDAFSLHTTNCLKYFVFRIKKQPVCTIYVFFIVNLLYNVSTPWIGIQIKKMKHKIYLFF